MTNNIAVVIDLYEPDFSYDWKYDKFFILNFSELDRK